jgi:hypothetical protein
MNPLLTIALVTVCTAVATRAQDQQDPAAPGDARAATLLATLDTGHTDWVALQDVGDKFAALGATGRAELDRALAAAATREDRRFELRLLGVLARFDATAVPRLGLRIGDDEEEQAAIAARVLGRSTADTAAVALELNARLRTERRPLVLGALALAAAEAGCAEAAPAIRRAIEAGAVPERPWLHQAHAMLAVGTPATTLVEWLGNDALRPSALLLARTSPDGELAAALLRRRGDDVPDLHREWLLQSLGAIGGRDAMVALRTDLRDAPRSDTTVPATPFDARRLALLRLGDPDARKLALATLRGNGKRMMRGVSAQFLDPELPQLAELLGKWRLLGIADELHDLIGDEKVLLWSRSRAARGLGWQQDLRGLHAAAKLLTAAGTTIEFGGAMAHATCQATLHEFVANADRPDYVPLGTSQLDPRAAEVGTRWQTWLAANATKVTWREPRNDGEMLLWR